MKHDLIALSEQFPGIMVQVSLEDLLTAGKTLSAEILDHIDTKADNVSANPKEDTFLSCEETMNKLKLSGPTLWRWKKSGYLIPIQLGTMDRYRLSYIEPIIVKKGGTLRASQCTSAKSCTSSC